MSKPSTSWQTKWPERISYGLSDAADNLVFQVMTSYLLFFIPTFMAYKPAQLPYSFSSRGLPMFLRVRLWA